MVTFRTGSRRRRQGPLLSRLVVGDNLTIPIDLVTDHLSSKPWPLLDVIAPALPYL